MYTCIIFPKSYLKKFLKHINLLLFGSEKKLMDLKLLFILKKKNLNIIHGHKAYKFIMYSTYSWPNNINLSNLGKTKKLLFYFLKHPSSTLCDWRRLVSECVFRSLCKRFYVNYMYMLIGIVSIFLLVFNLISQIKID